MKKLIGKRDKMEERKETLCMCIVEIRLSVCRGRDGREREGKRWKGKGREEMEGEGKERDGRGREGKRGDTRERENKMRKKWKIFKGTTNKIKVKQNQMQK